MFVLSVLFIVSLRLCVFVYFYVGLVADDVSVPCVPSTVVSNSPDYSPSAILESPATAGRSPPSSSRSVAAAGSTPVASINKDRPLHISHRSISPPPASTSFADDNRRYLRWVRTIASAAHNLFGNSASWLSFGLPSQSNSDSAIIDSHPQGGASSLDSARGALLQPLISSSNSASSPSRITVMSRSYDDSDVVDAKSSLPLMSSPPLVPRPLPASARAVTSFQYEAWAAALPLNYSARPMILDAIANGVRLGFIGERAGIRLVPNHPSAMQPAAMVIIDEEIRSELAAGRMAGPFPEPPFAYAWASPMAVVPKNDGGWRIIDDLSYGDRPVNESDTIEEERIRVRYAKFQTAVRAVRQYGRNCLMAKVDWKSAFRQIAVHVDDWPLLGLHWRNQWFFRLVLPFGLRSSPYLFTCFAKAFAVILRARGISFLMYYLDDILVIGRADTDECAAGVALIEQLAAELGITLHPTKRAGPTTHIDFLGLGIDSEHMRLFIPADKRKRVASALRALVDRRQASYRELQKVAGSLGFITNVLQPGRVILRSIFTHMSTLRHRHVAHHHHIDLPQTLIEDFQWWIQLLDRFEYTEPIIRSIPSDPADAPHIYTDACETGAGAVLMVADGSSARILGWWHLPWPEAMSNQRWHINALEYATVLIALSTWAPSYTNGHIFVHSDNQATVDGLTYHRERSHHSALLARAVAALAITCSISLTIQHIRGAHNRCADICSRLSQLQGRPSADQLITFGLTPQLRLSAPVVPSWLSSLPPPTSKRS